MKLAEENNKRLTDQRKMKGEKQKLKALQPGPRNKDTGKRALPELPSGIPVPRKVVNKKKRVIRKKMRAQAKDIQKQKTKEVATAVRIEKDKRRIKSAKKKEAKLKAVAVADKQKA